MKSLMIFCFGLLIMTGTFTHAWAEPMRLAVQKPLKYRSAFCSRRPGYHFARPVGQNQLSADHFGNPTR